MKQAFSEPMGKVKTVSTEVNGQTFVLLPSEERARCNVCRMRKSTTVNGVCLSCLQKDSKHVH